MKNVKKIVETRNESFSLFLHLHKQRDIQSTVIQVEIYDTQKKNNSPTYTDSSKQDKNILIFSLHPS